MTSMEYIRCPNPACNKSNPVEEKDENKQYTCIFCGRPFTLPETSETRQISREGDGRENRIPRTPPREPIDRNQSKPVDRNQSKVLR